MARIFISYRRSDSAYVAATLTDKLQQHFGQDSIFLDVDNIPIGVDFREHIGNAVGQCDVLLVIMGDQWVRVVDSKGNRRIDHPSDYVRIEIESALKRHIPVIPVLVDEAEMPSANDLPASIQTIAFYNAAELSAGRDRHQHMDRLIQGLEAIFSQKSLPADKEISHKDPAPKPAAKSKPKASRAQAKATSDKNPAHNTEALSVVKEDDPSKLLGEIEKILNGFTDKFLFVGKAIPLDKLKNARSVYAPQVSPKDVLVLYDNTAFGGAKDGLILTADAVYWRSSFGTEPDQIRYTEIQNLNFSKGGTFSRATLLINEKEIFLNMGDDKNKIAASLMNVIRYLASRQTNLKA